MKPHFTIAGLLVALLPLGCQTGRLVREGNHSRDAILELYTNQVLDNLIRAKNNLPFVQLAYKSLSVQDTDSLSGTAGDTFGDGRTTGRNGLGVLLSASHAWTNSLNLGGTASRGRTISYAADPITDKNDIYLLYLGFAHDPSLFAESDTKPCFPVHMLRKYRDHWYYVPVEAAPVFLELVLRTTFMRGPDTAPPPYYDRKIANLYCAKDPTKEANVIELNTSLPSGDADMDFTYQGKRYRLQLRELRQDYPLQGKKILAVPKGQPTVYFLLDFPGKLKDQFPDCAVLVGMAVQIFSHDFPPPVPQTSPELQRIANSVDLINLNLRNLTVGR